jgi:hypothetical protein
MAGVVTWLRAQRPKNLCSIPGRYKSSFYSKEAVPAVGPTQPPVQLIPGTLLRG